MKEFDSIYLSWRKGTGSPRFLVGKIELPESAPAQFKYDEKQVFQAQKEGFSPYTEFPKVGEVYSQHVLDIFGQRLTKSVRPDIQSYYNFWEVDPAQVNDKAYMLAHTQGLLPSDNFEFLADFNPVPALSFLTDLAHTSKLGVQRDFLKKGERLTIELDPKNQFDSKAVVVFKEGAKIGYIKRVHCHVFHKTGADKLEVSVKAVEQNGIIRRVFAKVSMLLIQT